MNQDQQNQRLAEPMVGVVISKHTIYNLHHKRFYLVHCILVFSWPVVKYNWCESLGGFEYILKRKSYTTLNEMLFPSF